MNILDGTQLAAEKSAILKVRVAEMVEKGRRPSLAAVLVGDDYASHLYVKLKEKEAKAIGMDFHKYLFDADVSQEELVEAISFLRDDDDISAMIVQFPLPEHLDADTVIAALGVEKDADGFHPENISAFNDGSSDFWPVFPKALIALAQASEQNLEDKNGLIIAKSDIFSEAMIAACTRVGLKVFQKECGTDNAEALQAADVVFTACGTPKSISPDDVKDGAIIVDGGISKKSKDTVGDVDFAAFEKAKKDVYLTPVPGGVGPMTIACLLENALDIAMKDK